MILLSSKTRPYLSRDMFILKRLNLKLMNFLKEIDNQPYRLHIWKNKIPIMLNLNKGELI